MPPKQKKKIKKVSEAPKQCQIPTPPNSTPSGTLIDSVLKPELLSKWPKLKLKVPAIFLHKPVDLEQHIKKILSMGIKIYHPYLGRYYTKISCHTFNDHKSLIQYFEKKQLPYHTFGHPLKRKMKVVIRGLPPDTDVNKVKGELKSLLIPVIRVHKMHTKEVGKNPPMLVLVVVPYDNDGKTMLKVKQILGHIVKLEPPITKTKQCFRCQKWGHSQRYCHGEVKCVKCAGDHSYKKCERNAEEEPPKCANCGGEHTANYRQCSFCPDSDEHKETQMCKKSTHAVSQKKPQLVTMENYHNLYRNFNYELMSPKSIMVF